MILLRILLGQASPADVDAALRQGRARPAPLTRLAGRMHCAA